MNNAQITILGQQTLTETQHRDQFGGQQTAKTKHSSTHKSSTNVINT